MIAQTLHNHTDFCDGKDTPEEMVKVAIAKGFRSIGFSGHSYMHFVDSRSSMPPSVAEEYQREIARLKEAYRDQISIFCGLEVEMYSEVDLSGYDYLIGSTHYFNFDGKKVGYDRSAPVVKQVIDEYFGGDGMRYAKAYYEQIVNLPKYGKFDIIGHFDLVSKHAEKDNFFDQYSPKYLAMAYDAIDALAGQIPLFEVNTGAIARGYRTTPYPTLPLIKRFREKGFGAVVGGDCHDAQKLDCAFDLCVELLKEAGFREYYVLTEEGFQALPLG